MKKMKTYFTFILFLFVLVTALNAQENQKGSKFFYLSESFETGIPDSWSVENTGDLSWEHQFDYVIALSNGYPSLHIAGILASPVVDVSSATSLRLLFNHKFWSMGDASAVVEVFDGTNWEAVSIPSTYGEQDIDVTAYVNDSFQVRFVYDDGNIWELYWKLFDVIIYSPEINDMAVKTISPSAVLLGESTIPQVTIHNYGTSEGVYDLQLTIDGTSYDENLTNLEAVSPGTDIVIDFPEWIIPNENNYNITAVLTYNDDNDPSNNTKDLGCTVMPYHDAMIGHVNGKYFDVGLETGDLTQFGGFESLPFTMADEYANGKIYRMTEWLEFWEVAVDGSLTKVEETNLYDQWIALGYQPFNYALAYNWNTNRMYMAGDDGADWPVGNPHLAYFDMETYELTYVGQINTGAMIVGMDFADDGLLYGVGLNGNLYKMNVNDFNVEIVGATGLGSINKDFQDLSYDRVDHILYGVLRDNSYYNKFGTINIESGEFTIIQDYTDFVGYVGFAITRDPIPVYTLTFTIDDGENTIEGAEIDINGETLTSNAIGVASIELENGDYDFTVTFSGYYDYNGMVSIEDGTEEVLVSLDKITGISSMKNGFSLSPNPSQGRYKITSESAFTYEVYDMNGIKIYSSDKGATESILDISDKAKGIYFIKIRTKSDSEIFKLIHK